MAQLVADVALALLLGHLGLRAIKMSLPRLAAVRVLVVLVNDLEDAFCEQPRQLAVVDEGDLVDAFLLVVRTLLQVVEDVLEVGHAHLFLEFVVLHSLCKQ